MTRYRSARQVPPSFVHLIPLIVSWSSFFLTLYLSSSTPVSSQINNSCSPTTFSPLVPLFIQLYPTLVFSNTVMVVISAIPSVTEAVPHALIDPSLEGVPLPVLVRFGCPSHYFPLPTCEIWSFLIVLSVIFSASHIVFSHVWQFLTMSSSFSHAVGLV